VSQLLLVFGYVLGYIHFGLIGWLVSHKVWVSIYSGVKNKEQKTAFGLSDEELNAFWPMALGNVRIAISCGLSSCLYQV